MSSLTRVAVVTGANKGIGYAIVRGLCQQFEGDVYLTARNSNFGRDAVKKLNGEGLQPIFHELDLNDIDSIERIKSFLLTNYGGLDILVNNAGIYRQIDVKESFAQQAEDVVTTNFTGTLNVCKALFPILRAHARVVNISSLASCRDARRCGTDILTRFLLPHLTLHQLEEMMKEFVMSTKAGDHKEKGWSESTYGVSKIGVTLLSFIQQKELAADHTDDIIVNACCPGSVATDMTGFKGIRTTDEGADTPVYLALLPPNTKEPRGQMVFDRKVVDWPYGFNDFNYIKAD